MPCSVCIEIVMLRYRPRSRSPPRRRRPSPSPVPLKDPTPEPSEKESGELEEGEFGADAGEVTSPPPAAAEAPALAAMPDKALVPKGPVLKITPTKKWVVLPPPEQRCVVRSWQTKEVHLDTAGCSGPQGKPSPQHC